MKFLVFVAAFIFCGMAAAIQDVKYNIIVLVADDMGWNGPACYGSDLHETPNIDKLAAQGMRFTNGYSACTVCSPSRAALLTGKYPARLHVTDWITGTKRPFAKLRPPKWTMRLVHDEVTLAEALRKDGYGTIHIGKWHLGSEGFLPEDHGFDTNVGGTDRGGPPGGYFLPNKLDLPGAKKGQYLTDYLTDRALELITKHEEKPFFLYMPYYAVHTPIQGREDYTKEFEGKVKRDGIHTNATYAAMTRSVDDSVGRIMKKLEELEIADFTVVIFTSDNGGLSHKKGRPTGITNNGAIRRGKGSAYEGGVRVPFIVKWPEVTKPGSVSDVPVCGIDVYPTVLEMTGTEGDRDHNTDVDGVSLVPILKGESRKLSRPLYWHYPHYHAGGDSPYGAVREGDWRLVEFYEDGKVELFNLADDLAESRNLADSMPEKVEELKKKLAGWRLEVDAQMPEVNPDADLEKDRKQWGG